MFAARLPVQTQKKICHKVTDLFWERNINQLAVEFSKFQMIKNNLSEGSNLIAIELEKRTGGIASGCAFIEMKKRTDSVEIEILEMCLKWRNRVDNATELLFERVNKEINRKRIPLYGEQGEEEMSSYYARFSFEEIKEWAEGKIEEDELCLEMN